jgi:hypothetical protein
MEESTDTIITHHKRTTEQSSSITSKILWTKNFRKKKPETPSPTTFPVLLKIQTSNPV